METIVAKSKNASGQHVMPSNCLWSGHTSASAQRTEWGGCGDGGNLRYEPTHEERTTSSKPKSDGSSMNVNHLGSDQMKACVKPRFV
eukprot:3188445-Prymnesium_polylepis.1